MWSKEYLLSRIDICYLYSQKHLAEKRVPTKSTYHFLDLKKEMKYVGGMLI